MTVGDLKNFIAELDDEMIVVTDAYNGGYGGHFEADASVRKLKNEGIEYSESEADDGEEVLRISNYF
jgi:hypothetical protein